MNNKELKSLRMNLNFSLNEAAELILPQPVKPRSWRLWERGDRFIPDELIFKMIELMAWQQTCVNVQTEIISARIGFRGNINNLDLCQKHDELPQLGYALMDYPETLEDFLKTKVEEPIYFRPWQSVLGLLYTKFYPTIRFEQGV